MRIFKKTLYKRDGTKYQSKKWYIQYRNDKGDVVTLAVSENRKEADDVASKMRVESIEKRFFDIRKEQKVLFSDAAKQYLEFSRNNKRSYTRDVLSLKYLCAEFGTKYLYNIYPEMIEEYKIKRASLVMKSTANRELCCLRHLLNKAVASGYIKQNPMKTVKLFKEEERNIRYLKSEEIIMLYSKCDPALLPIIITAVNTGMRRGEILKLKRTDVDFKQGTITVRSENAKSGMLRVIPLNNILTKALRDVIIDSNIQSEYVFCHKDGTPYREVRRKTFDRALKDAKIDNFRFHDLRHTFASHLVMNGVDLVTVKELLGHKSIEMTLRYSHLSGDHKRLAVVTLEKNQRPENVPQDKSEV
ncbi:MAG: hypothetical protein A2231_11535 [Candidatus Firestonebacteria bacterium RIFOXYA2_FULL_40_8]|nr:MAG: hypothetical protein A2231_11535 [Candidatus Firestonebacteria bacterium RIFOXYA2_FULL_40_8]